jgi:hypothetical protein
MFNFEKLDGWQHAIEFADAVYEKTRRFPSEERFGLTNQMRRAAGHGGNQWRRRPPRWTQDQDHSRGRSIESRTIRCGKKTDRQRQSDRDPRRDRQLAFIGGGAHLPGIENSDGHARIKP